MDLRKLEDLRVALKLAGIKPRHELGQNFLVDADTLNLIVQTAQLNRTDTVLEIGAGLGTLTAELAQRAGTVIAVEADPRLAQLLKGFAMPNVEVVSQDILVFDLTKLQVRYKVVANIPYYLTSQIIRILLESPNPPAQIVVLIQKEVAARICAKPGDMSVLALSVQYYGEPRIAAQVSRDKFWPSPEVDSAVLQIKLRNQPAFPADSQKLFRLIKAGFGEKRKMLKNSLAGGLNAAPELIGRLLSGAKLKPESRAQELSLSQWHKLYTISVKHKLI